MNLREIKVWVLAVALHPIATASVIFRGLMGLPHYKNHPPMDYAELTVILGDMAHARPDSPIAEEAKKLCDYVAYHAGQHFDPDTLLTVYRNRTAEN